MVFTNTADSIVTAINIHKIIECVREVWDVVGVGTPLVRGGAQVLHGDQVVELSVLLGVHEKGEVEEDGEDQIEVESERSELKERRTWMTMRMI